ncbi:Ig-like domain-containing protein [Leifsonia sp. NPDC058194]|uniref:Ig-like domain-containing protein n=1 Tax=Leifsonia sp. NPDC058194 TaxID=3346374 RepID=UPI0036D9AB62
MASNASANTLITLGVKADQVSYWSIRGYQEVQVDVLTIDTPTTGATVGMSGVTVKGTARPDATVEVSNAGVSIGSAIADSAGAWTMRLTLPEGIASLSFASGTKTEPLTLLVIDDSAPLVVTTPKAGSTVVGAGVEFAGTAEPGATVTIKDAGGNPVGSTVAAGDGSYTVTVVLPEGSTSATVATDTRSVTIEDLNVIAKLEVTTPKADATIGTNGAEFTGKGQPDEKVTITDKDGNVLGETTVDGNGNWTTSVKVPEGSAPITVTAGDQTVVLDKVNVVDDTAALVVTTPQGGSTIVGSDVTFDGTGQPGETVVIKDADGKTIGETTVNPDGSWNTTVPLPGGGSVTIEAGDQTVTIEDLNVIAKLEVTTPKADATIGTNGAEFTGKGQPDEKVTITDKDGNILGETTVGKDGNWTTSVKVPEGSAPITVTAGDQTVVLDKVTVVDDTAALVVTTPQGGATIVGPDVTFDGTGQPGETVVIKDNDGKTIGETTVNPDGSWDLTVPLPGGGSITIEAGDQTVTIEDLNVIAKLEVTTPKADATIGTNGAEFTGKGQPDEKVTITDKDGTVLGETTVGKDGNWTTSVKVPEGSAPITVTAGDQTVVLDNLQIIDDTPQVADFVVVSPTLGTGDNSITEGTVFTGTGEPGTTIVLTDQDGTVIGEATVDGNGDWSTPVTGLTEGPNNITATITVPGNEPQDIDLGAVVVVSGEEGTPLMDPTIAGGTALALLAAAGSFLLIRRRREAAQQ